jgi:hypothetical protein
MHRQNGKGIHQWLPFDTNLVIMTGWLPLLFLLSVQRLSVVMGSCKASFIHYNLFSVIKVLGGCSDKLGDLPTEI